MQEIADLKAGVPVHTHTCPEGRHEWRCTSPYCFSVTAACLEHDGGPIGRPPQYDFDKSYVREVLGA